MAQNAKFSRFGVRIILAGIARFLILLLLSVETIIQIKN